jgi:hypothetical protein
MKTAHDLSLLALFAVGSAPVAATDLSKIERTIAKDKRKVPGAEPSRSSDQEKRKGSSRERG